MGCLLYGVMGNEPRLHCQCLLTAPVVDQYSVEQLLAKMVIAAVATPAGSQVVQWIARHGRAE